MNVIPIFSLLLAGIFTGIGGLLWRRVQRQLTTLQDRINQLTADYYQQCEQTRQAEQTLADVTAQYQGDRQHYLQQIQTYQGEQQRLMAELDAAHQRGRTLTAELQTQQQDHAAHLQTLETQWDHEKDTLTQQITQIQEAARGERTALEIAHTQALHQQRETLETQIHKLETDNRELAKTLDEFYATLETDIQTKTQDLEKNNQELQQLTQELQEENSQLKQEVFRIKQEKILGYVPHKSSSSQEAHQEILELTTTEIDFYGDEKRTLILTLLKAERDKLDKTNRRKYLLDDILDHNPINTAPRDGFESQLKTVFSTYQQMDGRTRRDIMALGFTITEDGKHYKLIFKDDDRHTFGIPKSGSDHRGGKNLFSWIRKSLL